MAVYMTNQAAKLLGVAKRTMIKYCKKLDIPKVGRYYIIDGKSLNRIRKALGEAKVGNPGRPRGKKNISKVEEE